ncbi:MAG: hypothetical protein AAGC63_16785 [Propionicimonas sp.]|nr:hypothetical protein [Propionicimonas sp.]
MTVAELRAATTRLLDAMEVRFGPELRLQEDLYWNVPVGEATQIEAEPHPDLGSVVDDVDSVRDFLAQEDSDYVSIWHEADHIAGLFRSIARLDLRPPE